MIQLPMEPEMASLMVHTPLWPSNTTASMAGHTVSTRESNRITPINTPMTRMPISVRGAAGGGEPEGGDDCRVPI